MASSSTSSMLGNSDQTSNGTKLMRLILDGGTEALRNVFRNIHAAGNLQVVLYINQRILSNLKKSKIINQKQWDKLYPVPPNRPNINDLDVTLLSVLLRNICGLSPPCSGWDNKPNVGDHSVVADIVRIKLFRNERFGHIAKTAVNTADFKIFWAEISLPLVRLGIDRKEIDRLENEECAEEEVENVLNDIKDDVKALTKKDKESRSDGILNKHLVWCDFQTEIELYNAKFTKGTREWVFENLSTWFNDETSKSRAFVICGLPGMGKSVIAAVICKRFAEHVGASHFFQYNNSQYSNPNFFLQSLAWHLCKIVPLYKEALIQKLSGNLGQSLNSMNIEGLFSILFKEPFSGIAEPGKRILIVLDAVDESEYHGRDELANLISDQLHKTPSYIRFVITTRPEKNLLDKFKELNPLYVEPNDIRNLNDIILVLQERISTANRPTKDFINNIAETSGGLMLNAFFLSEMFKDEPSILSSSNSLPKGVKEYYKKYFQRLERELNLLEISDDKFLSFLSALAVANEALPEAFVTTLFGFKNSPTARRKVTKAINSISSLLVLTEDKSISIFHKSIRDWLVDNSEHDYSVDVQYGHKILFDICVKILDDLKKTGVSNEGLACVAVKYALKHCIEHLLSGPEDREKLVCFVSYYVADLEVMFASVCVNVDLTLNNCSRLMNHEIYKNVSENIRKTLNRLIFVIGKFDILFRDYPQTFLQNVYFEGGEELSFKASNLLQTRYKDITYLELVNKDRKNDALEARFLLSGKISGIDISPKHDYVICSYIAGGIELFSLAAGKSEWKIQDFLVKVPAVPFIPDRNYDTCTLPHCIVFHPHESLILPGRLDKVLTLQGTFTVSPFQSDEASSIFTNCCFSLDGNRMVTYFSNCLIVWNVLSAIKERCLPCNTLYSFSFTASGNFLGTTDIENAFAVYDVTNDYKVISKRIDCNSPVEIVSTLDQNLWLCSVHQWLQVVNHNLFISSSRCHLNKIVLPSNVHSSRELQRFLQRPEQSWFSRVKKNLTNKFGLSRYAAIRYVLTEDHGVLVFSCNSNIMSVFNIEGLMNTEEQEPNINDAVVSDISTNGDFVYLNNRVTKRFTICELGTKDKHLKVFPESNKLSFQVVRDGVILLRDSDTPELWSSDLAERLASFDKLAGTSRCLSVSDEVIACVYEDSIKFFDVFSEQITCTTIFKEGILLVHACSIKYYVLAETVSNEIPFWDYALMQSGKTSLLKDGEIVKGWGNVFDTQLREIFAEFSPEGNRLALSSTASNKIVIFDVVSKGFLAHVPIYVAFYDLLWLKFFDDENLLCSSANRMLYFINVERGEILTCVDVGDNPVPISICRKRGIVCAGLDWSENFDLIKVALPR
ncbi:E3 ubiquitin- ligase DZIP3 [Paramuricea clavata]|uniref:E3 ubiquitin- ligase DZIP3 n=1 Tax=Paramuricea clavata TaxID=317549 RepID=A0A7D9HPY9_PARCT|nr:E3 ubiquitin- ligase DZIP3 [Paramuricea clavata]